VESLVVALKAEEDRKKVLSAELNTLGDLEKVISLDAHQIKKDVTARAADVRGLLGRRGPQARQLLRKLVVDRLECEPFEEGNRRGYRVSGTGTYARLLPGGECATSIGGSNGIRAALYGPLPRGCASSSQFQPTMSVTWPTRPQTEQLCSLSERRLRLRQPEAHVHLAVHRSRGR
jgi:hypothetical protein